ncbi:MAG: Hsp70 family protein [Oligoflexus sp.]|nr:Hsp70 family protein [Oligoflexus sp.]
MNVYGIDLGTTNTCISRFASGLPEIIRINDSDTVPSIVAWDGQRLLVGLAAKNYSFVSPENAIRSIKRKMGQLDFRVQLGSREFSPIDVSTEILRFVSDEAAKVVGEAIKTVVITVPAWFGDEQRRATLAAGKAAGLEVLRIINEPTAAALSYQLTQDPSVEQQMEKWLVYDLGGGTFDVSILIVKGDYKEVLATAGNTFLGGDDFDRLLAQRMVNEIRSRFNIDPDEDPVALAQLRHLAEEAKIALSTEPEHRITYKLSVLGKQVVLDLNITREEFSELIEDLVESSIAKVHQALDDAKLDAQELTRLILVGGSSRIPLVQERLKDEFGLSPELYIDPDLSVALGAGIQAALASGKSCKQIVVDVCPHTLGMAVLGDHDEMFEMRSNIPLSFAPLIQRNSRLPAKMTRTFCKMHPEQGQVEIVVFQGESSRTTDNQLIGRFICDLNPTAQLEFFVSFSYDSNGIIQIGVTQIQGQRPLKQYSMDTNKSEHWNSEPLPMGQGSDFLDIEMSESAAGANASEKVSNFLIEQVELQLQKASEKDRHRMKGQLQDYRSALLAEDNDTLDTLENELYEWLENSREQEDSHG